MQSLHITGCSISPTRDIPHFSGTFVTTDEPILTHYHPKSIVYKGFDICTVARTHHYSVTPNNFTALKYVLLIYPSLPSPKPLATTDLFALNKKRQQQLGTTSFCGEWGRTGQFSLAEGWGHDLESLRGKHKKRTTETWGES